MAYKHSDLVIMGGINDALLYNLTQELQQECYQRHIPLRLFISSPGGSMPLALTMSRMLLSLFDHIETYNFAIVDSAAVCLYLTGSKRYVFSSSRFLLHPASITLRESVNITQMHEHIRLIRSDTESMIRFYHERMEHDDATLHRWFESALVMTASEAIEQKIATDICRDIPDFSPRYLITKEDIPIEDTLTDVKLNTKTNNHETHYHPDDKYGRDDAAQSRSYLNISGKCAE